MLVRRKIKDRARINKGPKREWPRHRQFVRRCACVVNGCNLLPIEFAHLRTAANSGIALKPHDAFGVALCRTHHAEYHQIGHQSFSRKYFLNLFKLADEFVRRSPDTAMKEAMAEDGVHHVWYR